MTTKKSKPASLTSSLLARKGEAEPATAPYSIPESGRQPTADASAGKGNGNGNGSGSDLGNALSGMARPIASDKNGDRDDAIEIERAENGVHADVVQAVSASGSHMPPSDDLPDDGEPEMDLEVELESEIEIELEPEVEADVSLDDEDKTPTPEDEPSAEETLLEGAVAEEASIDEAVIEASLGADSAAERIAAETAAAIEKAGTLEAEAAPVDSGEADAASDTESAPDIGAAPAAAAAPIAAAVAAEKLSEDAGDPASAADGEREAARDARLLRFVYAMAALTGIVAIVLYAGGWLRDVPTQGQTETSVASSEPGASSDSSVAGSGEVTPPAETQQPAETAMTGPGGETTSSASGNTGDSTGAIPTAPPVTPPGTADEKPMAADSGLTTGGPAKPAVDTPVPMTPSAETLSSDSLGVAVPSPDATSAEAAAAVAAVEASDSSPQSTITVPVETPPVAAAGSPETQNIDTSGAVPSVDAVVAEGQTAASSGAGETVPGGSDSSQVVVPTPITPESVAPPPVSTEPVRDVPNMRVLAPALVRPEPAETAPPTGTGAAPAAPAAPPAEKQTAALTEAPAAPSGRYRVQLASVSSEALAKREWARLQKVFPDIFGDRTLVIEKKDIAGRGTFYRIQTGGYETLADARAVCGSLKAKKQACLPLKR